MNTLFIPNFGIITCLQLRIICLSILPLDLPDWMTSLESMQSRALCLRKMCKGIPMLQGSHQGVGLTVLQFKQYIPHRIYYTVWSPNYVYEFYHMLGLLALKF